MWPYFKGKCEQERDGEREEEAPHLLRGFPISNGSLMLAANVVNLN